MSAPRASTVIFSWAVAPDPRAILGVVGIVRMWGGSVENSLHLVLACLFRSIQGCCCRPWSADLLCFIGA